MSIIRAAKNIRGIIFSRKVVVVWHCPLGIPNHLPYVLLLFPKHISIYIKTYIIRGMCCLGGRGCGNLLLLVLVLLGLGLLGLGHVPKSRLVSMLLLSIQELIEYLVLGRGSFLTRWVSGA